MTLKLIFCLLSQNVIKKINLFKCTVNISPKQQQLCKSLIGMHLRAEYLHLIVFLLLLPLIALLVCGHGQKHFIVHRLWRY